MNYRDDTPPEEPSIQHKPVRVHSDLFFGDDQEPVEVEWHPRAEDARDDIEGLLLARGVSLDIIHEISEQLDTVLRSYVENRTADAVRGILLKVGDTPVGFAMRKVIGERGETLRAAGKRLGISHVAVWKREQRLKRRLRG